MPSSPLADARHGGGRSVRSARSPARPRPRPAPRTGGWTRGRISCSGTISSRAPGSGQRGHQPGPLALPARAADGWSPGSAAPGHARSRTSARRAQASMRCSQLSNSRSGSLGRRGSSQRLGKRTVGRLASPGGPARPGHELRRGERGQLHERTPSSYSSATCPPRPRREPRLAEPPGPVSVTSRASVARSFRGLRPLLSAAHEAGQLQRAGCLRRGSQIRPAGGEIDDPAAVLCGHITGRAATASGIEETAPGSTPRHRGHRSRYPRALRLRWPSP